MNGIFKSSENFQSHLLLILIPFVFSSEFIRNYPNNLQCVLIVLVFFRAIKFQVLTFFDSSFENLIDNFLISYFTYSHLAWSSLIFSLSKFYRVFAIWNFILSTKLEFKANELLNLHRSFPLASSWFMLKVKINGEWSE